MGRDLAERALHLAKDVHAVAINEDLVFLDARADAYFCLVEGARHLDLAPSGAVAARESALAKGLVEAGLLAASPTPRAPPPPRPTRSLWPPRALSRPSRPVAALRATLRARRGLARLPFLDLIRPDTKRGPAASTFDLRSDLAGFEHLRPWLPIDGECLSRSYHLRLFLSALGHDVTWVFGVRTWPFMVHCWLQVGDTALDDDVERLIAYHPILGV